MKKNIIIALLITWSISTWAQDLTSTVINTSSTASTGSVDLTVNGGTPPYAYSWSGPAGFTATSQDITGLAAGNYTVVVTDKYCGTATITVTVGTNFPNAISNLNTIEQFSIYPNPFQSTFSITYTSYKADNVTYTLCDVQGKKVFIETKTMNVGKNTATFSLNALSAGIYYFSASNNKGYLIRHKMVKTN